MMSMDGEFYEELRNDSRDYTDRYKNCSILRSSEEILLSTPEDIQIKETKNDFYHTVESHEVGRLDMLAAKYYRNPLLWWVIAKANNIYDPLLKIAPGTILRIPAIESLYGNNGILL